MSATNPLLRLVCIGLSGALLAALVGMYNALAQDAAVVTDADIARASRSQPVVTDQDIERARRKYRMPTDEELRGVPVPSAPRLDALPRPASRTAVDLEALAKGYAASTDPMNAAPAMSSGPQLLIFVSFSMPPATLQRLVDQAAKSHASLVLRGFVNGSLRDTVARVQALIGTRQVAFQIDPQAFDRFSVSHTPTFVLVHEGSQAQPCSAGRCLPADAFAATAGDVSLDYALEFIERSAPRFAAQAHGYLLKLRG